VRCVTVSYDTSGNNIETAIHRASYCAQNSNKLFSLRPRHAIAENSHHLAHTVLF